MTVYMIMQLAGSEAESYPGLPHPIQNLSCQNQASVISLLLGSVTFLPPGLFPSHTFSVLPISSFSHPSLRSVSLHHLACLLFCFLGRLSHSLVFPANTASPLVHASFFSMFYQFLLHSLTEEIVKLEGNHASPIKQTPLYQSFLREKLFLSTCLGPFPKKGQSDNGESADL